MRSESPLAQSATGSRESTTPAVLSNGTASRIPMKINVSWQAHNDVFMCAAHTLALPSDALQFTASESNTTYWRCSGADVRVGGAAGGARARERAVSRMRARAGAQCRRLRAAGGWR